MLLLECSRSGYLLGNLSLEGGPRNGRPETREDGEPGGGTWVGLEVKSETYSLGVLTMMEGGNYREMETWKGNFKGRKPGRESCKDPGPGERKMYGDRRPGKDCKGWAQRLGLGA